MIEEIKTICLVSIFAGITGALIPSGKMKSAFTSFCSVLVVFYMILPVADIRADSLDFSVFNDKIQEESLLSDVRTAEVMLYEQLLEKALEEKLRKMNLEATLKVKCEKLNDEITVISVDVSGCDGEEMRKRIKTMLTDSLGDIRVSFKEENNG